MEVKVALLWLRLCYVTYLIMCLCRQQCLVYSHLIINQTHQHFVLVALVPGHTQLSTAFIQYVFRSRTRRAWERGYHARMLQRFCNYTEARPCEYEI